MGVERLLKGMNIPFETLEGSASQVYSKFEHRAVKWIKEHFNGKYFLEVINEDQEPSGVVDGKVPLIILKTKEGEFYPIRLRRRSK